jgi:CheY-like chemotaxis protein
MAQAASPSYFPSKPYARDTRRLVLGYIVTGIDTERDRCSYQRMPRTVLVADDNPAIRKMLCQMFEREEQYNLCAEAENGKQAVELALQCQPDLIILDLSMPIMNGLEAAHALKKLMPKVPIILFTQHADLGNRLGIANMDIDRIVAKNEASTLMGHVRTLAPAW